MAQMGHKVDLNTNTRQRTDHAAGLGKPKPNRVNKLDLNPFSWYNIDTKNKGPQNQSEPFMSVCIVVKVSEGLVLGADSAASIGGRVEGPDGVREGLLKTYFNAQKLVQIGDFPIGVLTWGMAFIGLRTIESLVREWEHKRGWRSLEEYVERYAKSKQKSFRVETCAEELCKHLSQVYIEEFGDQPEEQRPGIGVMVAGYSQGQFFPEIWRFVLPTDCDGTIHDARPDRDGKPDFGANWHGATDAIIRLHYGRDEQAIEIISEKFNIPQEEVREILLPLQYQVPFAVMPLQDAIEYAYYMLKVAVGRFRFVVGAELCGGPIEIAAITQNKFNWISHKTWSLGGKGEHDNATTSI